MRLTAAVLVVALTSVQMPGAVRGDRAEYVGGTAPLKDGTQGVLDIKGSSDLVFTADKSTLKIPYQNITSLEFGQKIGRRVGVAIAVTWFAIFSKKKRHFLTVGYTADGAKQAAVFE